MMKKGTTIVMKNSDSADVSELLAIVLQNLGYTQEQIVHYTFLSENALYEWRERLPQDAELTFRRREGLRNTVLTLELPGDKFDPLNVEKNRDMTLVQMVDKLLSGVGSEITYTYKNGKNRLTLRLPRKNVVNKLFTRNMLILMLPVVMQQLFKNLASNADGVILGFLDSSSMSAVALVNRFSEIPAFMVSGIITAVTVMVTQLWGVRDRLQTKKVAGIALKLSLLVSLLFTAVSLIVPQWIMELYTDIPELIERGIPFLRCIAVTFVFSPVYLIYYSLMAATGRVKKSVLYAMYGCGINILLDLLLIPGLFGLPSLGVVGAGLARLVSGLFQVVLVVADAVRHETLRPDIGVNILKDPFAVSFHKTAFPSVLQHVTWNIAANIHMSAIGHMSAELMAANSALMIIANLTNSITDGAGTSAAILMGNLLGKGKLDEAKERSGLIMRNGIYIGLVEAGVFALGAALLHYLPLALDELTLEYCSRLLVFYAVNRFFHVLNGLIVRSALYAGGDVKALLIIDTVVMWGILVPVAVFLLRMPGLSPFLVIILLNNSETLSFPLKYIRMKRGKWLKNITK